MAWPIILVSDAWKDLNQFENRGAVLAELAVWAEKGPPCNDTRDLLGATIYEDETASGVKFQYVIGTRPRAFVGVVRIKRV